MTEKTVSSHSLRWLLEDHLVLRRRIAEMRQWWAELDELGLPKFGEMGTRLEELRDLLAEHFADEERDGYLAAALAAAPRFSRKAEELREQHGQFLEDLNNFINRLKASECGFTCWHEARDEFEAFIQRLGEHDRAENEIVQTAFGEDMGTSD